MSLLNVQGIHKTYHAPEGAVKVLTDVDFSLPAGGIHAIVGPSGCGKSTFLLTCGALIHPDSGSVTIDGENLLEMNSGKRALRRTSLIGYVFQQFHLIPYLNVEMNIMAASLASQNPKAKDNCKKLVEDLGLSHRLQHVPGKLSSGEQQRVALARALLNNPKVVIADEPTGNLDEENGEIVLKILREYANQGGLVVLATHSRDVANMADTIYTFDQGNVVVK